MYTFGTTHVSPYDARREADHGAPIEFVTDSAEVARFRAAIEAQKAINKPRAEVDQVEAVESLKYDLAKAGLI